MCATWRTITARSARTSHMRHQPNHNFNYNSNTVTAMYAAWRLITTWSARSSHAIYQPNHNFNYNSNTVTAIYAAWSPITIWSGRLSHVRHHPFLSIILFHISCTSLHCIATNGHNCIISLGTFVVFHISHFALRDSYFMHTFLLSTIIMDFPTTRHLYSRHLSTHLSNPKF